jgi:hypothetical protein
VEGDGEVRVYNGVHGRGQEGNVPDVIPNGELDVYQVRVNGHVPRDERDLIEAVSSPEGLVL